MLVCQNRKISEAISVGFPHCPDDVALLPKLHHQSGIETFVYGQKLGSRGMSCWHRPGPSRKTRKQRAQKTWQRDDQTWYKLQGQFLVQVPFTHPVLFSSARSQTLQEQIKLARVDDWFCDSLEINVTWHVKLLWGPCPALFHMLRRPDISTMQLKHASLTARSPTVKPPGSVRCGKGGTSTRLMLS